MVTRKDIAERAQVSVSVVSRALNNSGYVNAKKREQILQIESDCHVPDDAAHKADPVLL